MKALSTKHTVKMNVDTVLMMRFHLKMFQRHHKAALYKRGRELLSESVGIAENGVKVLGKAAAKMVVANATCMVL